MLLSYTSIIITQNNLIHQFYKMVSYLHITHYLLTNNVDTRDPIGSNNKFNCIPFVEQTVSPEGSSATEG